MSKERLAIIPAVYLFLEKDNKILLLKRFNTGYNDGNYSLVSGHLDGDETLKQAMIREAKEEAGIIISNLVLVHTIHRHCGDHERIDFFFGADFVGKPVNMEQSKCDDLSWFDINNLPKNIIPEIQQSINNIKNGVNYSDFGF